MPVYKMWLMSFVFMFLMISCSVTLVYYSLTGPGIMKERIFDTVSSALSDNIKAAIEKVKTNVPRLPDIVMACYSKHLRINKGTGPRT